MEHRTDMASHMAYAGASRVAVLSNAPCPVWSIQGGLGLAASGNIHPGKVSLFEPVHGSAPPLAGKGIANPVGSILTCAMMLEYLGFQTLSNEIEDAVRSAISANETTRDLGGQLSTEQAGAAIMARLAGDSKN